jgi:hypothetical protein
MAADAKTSEWLEAPNHYIVEADSADMPELLRQIPGPPSSAAAIRPAAASRTPTNSLIISPDPDFVS